MNNLTEFQKKFYNRINLKPIDNLKFEDLSIIMKSCSETFSFENLDIVKEEIGEITKESIYKQLLLETNGGLCYKLNGLLYYFLLDCRFDVYLSMGTVVNGFNPWGSTDCHVVNIVNYNNKKYLVDIGFGGFIALNPILINEFDNNYSNQIIKNENGLFKVILENSKAINSNGENVNYTHTFQYRKDDNYLIESERNWSSGFVFNLNKVSDQSLFIIQNQIIRDQLEITKGPLVVKLTNEGTSTLTENNLTITTHNGFKTKTPLKSRDHFNEILQKEFKINNPILKKLNKNKNLF
ncbi:hypothetical protein DICPUDRAFT_85177 [Dictyostelium purpureum]|uniref:arylamine N-acetyltransferase n=1 Tax=Dictyostelium purpureum TaxID=5786 RepID=F1A4Y5_DICPU|nr:uncharacterized protein DICPUDRAFT_85177 [Dictyostelium purpureum]EGC28749.1 hypothetical protein DICPUDRAFT_85177 [Dictyostelium purpureum]|eukprot:XP_003294728.1 hypothetical protein DICPUDRAFT_85177 [Dictyostelium purpureum]